jgi:hypothetical protein
MRVGLFQTFSLLYGKVPAHGFCEKADEPLCSKCNFSPKTVRLQAHIRDKRE